MPGYYTYLISSLPMLQFGSKPAFSLNDFLKHCAELIPAQDMSLIRQAVSTDAYLLGVPGPGILLKWKEFDLALRNELVKARAVRRKVDPEKFLRSGAHFDINITHVAQASLRQASILEAERYLDLERWKMLDQASYGHYFDLDFLLAYALKLVILERWVKIGAGDKAKLAEKASLR